MAETMRATGVVADSPTNVRKGRAIISPGTPREREVEIGEHFVKAQGGQNYVGSSWSPLGIDGADEERCLAQGVEPPRPIHERQMESQKNFQRKLDEEKRKRAGLEALTASPLVAAALPSTPQSELALQLAAFEGDEEMQLKVLQRYQKKQREAVVRATEVVSA